MKGTFIFLGTGGSTGVPLIGCGCAVCKSSDPHNNRLRPSALLRIAGKKIVIDTGPDFRLQALKHHIDTLEGVIYTHSHFDHVAGLDDLRIYYILHKATVPVLLSKATFEDFKKRYSYLFLEKSWGTSLAAQLHFQELEGEKGATSFLRVPLSYFSYSQGGTAVTGYRFGELAYVTDIRDYSDSIFEDLDGVRTLIVSAVKFTPTVMHFSVDEAIAFSRRVGASQTWITHLSHACDHEKTNASLPKGVALAYDGLEIELHYE